jgi:hypothetical protein
MNQHQTEKGLAIIRNAVETEKGITHSLKQLPQTGKKRNVFIKNYNRRPLNKRKRKQVMALVAFKIMMSAVTHATILSTPIPRYIKGGEL